MSSRLTSILRKTAPNSDVCSASLALTARPWSIANLSGSEAFILRDVSVCDGLSVFSMIGARAVETLYWTIHRSRGVGIRREHDRLVASDCSAVYRLDIV